MAFIVTLLIVCVIVFILYKYSIYKNKNCSTCKHKYACWNKIDDEYCQYHYCECYEEDDSNE